MSTSWKSQQGNGLYALQFETDSKEKYKIVEAAAQRAIDRKIEVNVKHCEYCTRKDNDFVLLNETGMYSGLDIEMNKQGMLRIRYFHGATERFETQDIINIKFCPVCGRKFTEDE